MFQESTSNQKKHYILYRYSNCVASHSWTQIGMSKLLIEIYTQLRNELELYNFAHNCRVVCWRWEVAHKLIVWLQWSRTLASVGILGIFTKANLAWCITTSDTVVGSYFGIQNKDSANIFRPALPSKPKNWFHTAGAIIQLLSFFSKRVCLCQTSRYCHFCKTFFTAKGYLTQIASLQSNWKDEKKSSEFWYL